MGGVAVAVQADHGDGPDPVVVRLPQRAFEGVEAGGAQHGAVGGDAFVHLDHPLVER